MQLLCYEPTGFTATGPLRVWCWLLHRARSFSILRRPSLDRTLGRRDMREPPASPSDSEEPWGGAALALWYRGGEKGPQGSGTKT
eukprot:1049740-Prymnesium_polylepis.1